MSYLGENDVIFEQKRRHIWKKVISCLLFYPMILNQHIYNALRQKSGVSTLIEIQHLSK